MAKLVQDYVAVAAKKFPKKEAIVIDGQSISYARLDEKGTQLANFLKRKGVRKGDRVCFCLPKSIDSFVVLLGILKADAIYVPISTSTPEARSTQILADSEARFVIVNERKSFLPGISAASEYINLNSEKYIFIPEHNEPISYVNDESDTAYILYTSGSTGQPKGVMISHANIINATEWAVEELGISSEDRISQHPPLNFDLSTFDLYSAFKVGATLYPINEVDSLFPGELVRFIEKNELTVWNSVPSAMVYMYLAGLVKPGRMSSLKKIFFNGEPFPTKFLAEWMKTYPEKEFVNMYGPTETTVQCTFYRIKGIPTELDKLVPIGQACRNTEVFSLKENGEKAGPGETGELYVGGLGVGKGYWGDPEKTKRSFVSHPFGSGVVYKTGDLVKLLPSGDYQFIGRKDFQVKVMGHRVELGDIETALYSLPYANEAGVVAVESKTTGGSQIVAFVSLKEIKKPQEIKDDLAKLIPSYMIPHQVEIKEILPRTGTGKIDRLILKDEYQTKN